MASTKLFCNLINVDFVETVVAEKAVEIIERLLAGDDGIVGVDVDAPRPVNPLLFDDVNFVRNLQ
jgi:hypothetical protein